MILHENQKSFLLGLFKHLKAIYLLYKEQKKPAMRKQLFLKTNLFKEWMKKFTALPAKEKRKKAMNEWENDDSDIPQALYRL